MSSPYPQYQQMHAGHDQIVCPAGQQYSAMPSSSDPAYLFVQEFPELAKLSREDLEEALRTPAYFDALFGTLPSIKAIYSEHESFLQRNVDVTAANTALRGEHESLKAETQAVFEEAQRLQGRWHQHTAPQQDVAYARFAGQSQLTRLRQAFGDQDRLSESLVSCLLEGTLSPDDFAKQFKEVRRVWYRRQLQTEKWLDGQVQWQ